jgi:uncharacterized protein (TIGR02391 family)
MPLSDHLLDSQVHAIEEAVRLSPLAGESFRWESRDAVWTGSSDGELPALALVGTDYAFHFEYHDAWGDGHGHHGPAGFQVMHTPGVQSRSQHEQLRTWEKVLEQFRLWLRLAARELGRDDVRAPRSPEDLKVAPFAEIWPLLHPEIREIARARFTSGQYADAVEASLKHVNEVAQKLLRDKTGEYLDGSKLMKRLFSPSVPVLVLGDLATDTGKSMQIGYMELFSGAMTGVRNPKAHANVTIDPSRAIHFLFLASLLRHKLDEARPAQGP